MIGRRAFSIPCGRRIPRRQSQGPISRCGCMELSGRYKHKIICIVEFRFTLVNPSISSNQHPQSDRTKILEHSLSTEIMAFISFSRAIDGRIALCHFEKSVPRDGFDRENLYRFCHPRQRPFLTKPGDSGDESECSVLGLKWKMSIGIENYGSFSSN